MTQAHHLNILPHALQRPFSGILFDLDGTIIDSEGLHYQAFAEALREHGYDLSSLGDEVIYGGSFRAMFAEIARRFQLSPDLYDSIYQRKVELTLAWPATNVELIDGIMSFLEFMTDRRIPMGVVTNSEGPYVDHIFSAFDLHQYFPHVVHADHVAHPKPAPDAYDYGKDLLQLPAEHIIVFENTDGGIAAAKAAGLSVIAIRSTDRSGASTYAAADLVIDHFSDSVIDDLTWHVRDRN